MLPYYSQHHHQTAINQKTPRVHEKTRILLQTESKDELMYLEKTASKTEMIPSKEREACRTTLKIVFPHAFLFFRVLYSQAMESFQEQFSLPSLHFLKLHFVAFEKVEETEYLTQVRNPCFTTPYCN